MGKHSLGPDQMPLGYVAAKFSHRNDLRMEEIRVTIGMARIDDFDADRAGIDVGVAAPRASSGMPRAVALAHHLHHRPVLVDEIVR